MPKENQSDGRAHDCDHEQIFCAHGYVHEQAHYWQTCVPVVVWVDLGGGWSSATPQVGQGSRRFWLCTCKFRVLNICGLKTHFCTFPRRMEMPTDQPVEMRSVIVTIDLCRSQRMINFWHYISFGYLGRWGVGRREEKVARHLQVRWWWCGWGGWWGWLHNDDEDCNDNDEDGADIDHNDKSSDGD